MDSFNIGREGVNSGPGSYRVLVGVWTDGPGFSLCAVPLESFGVYFKTGGVMGRTRGGPG